MSEANVDSERFCRQPRLNEHTRSPESPRSGATCFDLVQSPLLKAYMKQNPDRRRRFVGDLNHDGCFSGERRSDSSAVAGASPMLRDLPVSDNTRKQRLSWGSGVSPEGSVPVSTLKTPMRSVPDLWCGSEIVKSAPRDRSTRRQSDPGTATESLTRPKTITEELTKALSSNDEAEVEDSLMNISKLAYREQGLGIHDILSKHFHTQLLFLGSGACMQSGIARIASLLQEPKWRKSCGVQEAGILAMISGIKLTFDCHPNELMALDKSRSKYRHPLGPARRYVLEADTFSVLRCVVEAIVLALEQEDARTKHDLVYAGLGALWHLAACNFRGRSCLWLLLMCQERGLHAVFESMACFQNERHIQVLGMAIIDLAMRFDKRKTTQLGLDWNLRNIL